MKHLFAVTWQHIRRSPYQATAAIMIMTLTTFVGLSFFLLSLGSQQLLNYLEKKPQVIIFFNDSVTSADQVKDLVQTLDDTGMVASAKFVSKDQAFQIYRERNKNDPLLLELVTANTLPASLEVSGKSASDLPQLYEILKKAPNIEEISYQQEVVNALVGVLDKVRKFGAGLITFLLATSLLTILTIIGMKISLRRDEINVERLVGASPNYIRFPFLAEGFFYGVIGALVATSVLYSIIYLSTPHLLPYLTGTGLLPLSPIFMAEVFAGVLLTGGLVGMIGSFFAVWRYLKR